jgi:hypothetical protein
VLAVLGGLVGYALTAASWKLLPAVAPVSVPRLGAARADWTIFLFAVAVAIANGLLFGLAPALRSSRSKGLQTAPDLGTRGAASGRHDSTREALVIAEVAITAGFVVIGGQLLGNFIHLLTTDPGFRADRVIASVVLAEPERYKTPEQRSEIYRRFLEGARGIPGVTSAGTVDALPFSGENHGGFITATRQAATDRKTQAIAEINVVGGQYLQVWEFILRQAAGSANKTCEIPATP